MNSSIVQVQSMVNDLKDLGKSLSDKAYETGVKLGIMETRIQALERAANR